MENKSNPLLPVGVGFIGISIPLFISAFYVPAGIKRISILITGIVILALGILIVKPKRN